MNTIELNNVRKDAPIFNNKYSKHTPVVEVFSAMVNGKEIGSLRGGDKAVKHIMGLYEKAGNDDTGAIAELNTLRRFTIEAPVMEKLKMLSIFGTYTNVGFDETVEREVVKFVGERSREQASNGDVVFPSISTEVYQVPTFTVSGGFEVDYRRAALGDMSKENEGLAQVQTDIVNRANVAIIKRIYDAYKKENGVKYDLEAAGLTKTAVDDLLAKVRRHGKTTVIGDYSILSQFTPWAGYVGEVNSHVVTGISDRIIDELAANGLLGSYNGSVLAEMPNPYDLYAPQVTDASGAKNFDTMLPAGLAFVIPAGAQSPIATYSKGGLTSMTGEDVKTGKIISRYDIQLGCDLARGQAYKIGVIHDSNLDSLAD